MGLVALIGILAAPKYWNRILAIYLVYVGCVVGYVAAQLTAAYSTALALLLMASIIIICSLCAVDVWRSKAISHTDKEERQKYADQNAYRHTSHTSQPQSAVVTPSVPESPPYKSIEQNDPVLTIARTISETFMRQHYSNKYQITCGHQDLVSSHDTAEEWASVNLAARAEALIQQQLREKPRWFDGLDRRRKQYAVEYDEYERNIANLCTRLTEPYLEEKRQSLHNITRPKLSNYVVQVSAYWFNPNTGITEKRTLGYTCEEVMKLVEKYQHSQQLWRPEDWLQSTPPIGDFEGTYVLHNTTDDLYYVGQAVSIHKRLKQHFMHGGNYDVYADYKYGKQFTVQVYPLKNSGFQSLNEQERHYIEAFDAVRHGYNKTHGNLG
jgi:hypothetical protein